MKRIFFSLFSLLTCTLLLACGGDSDNTTSEEGDIKLDCTPSVIDAPAVGGEYTVNVASSKGEWTAYTDSPEWIKVETEGTASKTGSVKVKVIQNDGNSTRTATVVVKSGSARKSVTISQDAAMQVSPTNLYSKSAGETLMVSVTASGDWRADSKDSWITTNKQDANTLAITTTANDATSERTGSVVISCGAEQVTVSVKQGSVDDREIVVPIEGYHLVWHDEFAEDGSLDAKNWKHEVQNSGWVNHELQNYVNEKSPEGQLVTEIIDGKLHINCFKENGKIYSGRVYGNVKQGWQYGYVEAKIKLPSGKGTWPAFWMMPVNFKSWPHDGEIDIMEEVGYHPDYVSSSLHADGHVHSNGTQVTKEVYCKGAEGEFHIYGMEWTPEYFQFYVDGQKTLYYANPGTGVRDWPYDAPFYVILNLAWGGDWGGSKGVDESKLPVTMEVDYVRVFQK